MTNEVRDSSNGDKIIHEHVSKILGRDTLIQTWVCTFNKSKAESLLARRYHGQRPIDKASLARIEEAMMHGEYIESFGNPIHVSREGNLMNGQHRLQAVVNTDTEYMFYVVDGLPEETFPFMDQHKARTIKEQLALLRVPNPGDMASTTNLLYHLMTEDTRNPRAAVTVRMVQDHPRLGDAVVQAKKMQKAAHIPVKIGAALHFLYSTFDQIEADKFFTLLTQGGEIMGIPSHPITKLKDTLVAEYVAKKKHQSTSKPKLDEAMMAWIHQAWMAFLADEPLRRWSPTASHPNHIDGIAMMAREAVTLRLSYAGPNHSDTQQVA
mgnify:CR=1 FL=1